MRPGCAHSCTYTRTVRWWLGLAVSTQRCICRGSVWSDADHPGVGLPGGGISAITTPTGKMIVRLERGLAVFHLRTCLLTGAVLSPAQSRLWREVLLASDLATDWQAASCVLRAATLCGRRATGHRTCGLSPDDEKATASRSTRACRAKG